jgi:hypothetical protein
VLIQKSLSAGVEIEGMLDDLQALGLKVEPFTAEDGELAVIISFSLVNYYHLMRNGKN